VAVVNTQVSYRSDFIPGLPKSSMYPVVAVPSGAFEKLMIFFTCIHASICDEMIVFVIDQNQFHDIGNRG